MSRSQSLQSLVVGQFGPRADAYVSSAVHAAGVDLDRIEAIAHGRPGARVLDLGCGGGHVSYRTAPHAAQVTAYDLSREMLDVVEVEAARRGFSNIDTLQGAAERLPFEDGAFDLVISRFSAHHWADLDAGLREARRVLAAGGAAVFVDAVSPGPPLLDTHLQAVELLRDPSHVRDYSAAEWLQATERAGFAMTAAGRHRLPMAFDAWVERMKTPPDHIRAIRALQRGAADAVVRHFEIGEDGSFSLDVLRLELTAA